MWRSPVPGATRHRYTQHQTAVGLAWHRAGPRCRLKTCLCALLLCRQRTLMMSGGTLELGRGQHLMRVTAAADYPVRVSGPP
jgi:hypothetical protein